MDYVEDLAAVLVYGAVGIALLVVGYFLVDALTPGHLGRSIMEGRNINAAVVAGSVALALGAVVTSAIAASHDDSLAKGLGTTAGYGAAGILILLAASVVIDVITPGRLSDAFDDERLSPVSVLFACFMLAVGAILAAAIT